MSSSKHLLVLFAALVVFAGACGNEGGAGLPTVDTVPPVPPVGVQIRTQADQVVVTWYDNAEIDLAGYRLYRSSSVDGPFGVVSTALVYCPWFYDEVLAMQTTYYTVTAVDQSGNESAYSQTVGIYYNTDNKRVPEAPIE
jgi:fibronectin type 3 domain-containing protein